MTHTEKKHAALVVLSTAPSMEVARSLAQILVGRRLAACVNLVDGIESHYLWEGEVHRDGEVLMVCKTNRSQIATLTEVIVDEHPYDCPEVVALPVEGGFAGYLSWIDESVS